ncbi:MAG TPA: M1 family aminopeptidase [Chloroflexia bacterium]|nr:M1 family aminopeptidase [Chloroflexia bacterium]
MDPSAYRLPRAVLPRQYTVALDARIDRPDYWGQVAIDLEVIESAPAIELHAQDLILTNARLTAGGTVYPGSIELDAAREQVRVTFATALPVGAGRLEIDFRGQVSQGLEGLYLAQDGSERLLCTQCEATSARRIFPCFDEPTFKARLAWQITTAADATVLANGVLAAATASADGSAKTWTFAPTKPLSTYLAALTIGPLASTPEMLVRGTPLRVWALAGKEPLGAFAQAYTARLLPWYEDYFAIPYHWQKLDQVGVPGFAAGAMENVGLVLYRQSLLLMSAPTASWEQQKLIALIIAHEFAHMWFGNLVTMQWWDDLWLNEAFAQWLAFQVVATLTPEYNIWDDFQQNRARALAADALSSTHPIYSPVATSADARDLFDAITYDKGCAVLRMLHHFLGAGPFRTGLQQYLRTYAESNAVGGDLWRALQAASHEPVVQIMDAWVQQAGYPLIAVALEQDGPESRLHLSQERFYSSPLTPPDMDTLWPVPLVIHYEDSGGTHVIQALLTERQLGLPLPVQGTLLWSYANAGEIGFYRQQLAPALLRGLLTHLDRLAPAEQVGLLGDQWALVYSGRQPIGPVLTVLAQAAHSDHYQVLAATVKYLHTLADLIEGAGDALALQGFRTWVATLFKGRLADLGFVPQAGESRNRTQTRVAVLDALTTLAHDPDALAQARAWAAREAGDPAAVDASLAPLFLAATAQFGDAALFDRYVEIYRQRKAAGAPPQETDRYLLSFPWFRAPALTAQTLALLDSGVVPLEGMAPVLQDLFAPPWAQVAAWEYLKARWAILEELVPSWIPAAVAITGQLPASLRADMVAFYDAHLAGEATLSYARALEQVDQHAAFQARTQGDLLTGFHPGAGA